MTNNSIQVHLTGNGDSARDSNNKTTEYSMDYIVIGATTKDEALDAVFTEAPKTYNGLSFAGVSFSGYQDGALEISAKYQASSSASNNNGSQQDQFSWDISSNSQKIVKALGLVACKALDGDDDDYKTLAIGWNGRKGAGCKIEGTNILAGAMRESFTIYKKFSQINNTYKRLINSCYGKVNSKGFKGWEAGEVLFVGVSSNGDTNRSAEIPLTFNFAIRENKKKVEIANGTYASMEGWDTLNPIMDSAPSDDQLFPKVKAFLIHRVYYRTDLNKLGV